MSPRRTRAGSSVRGAKVPRGEVDLTVVLASTRSEFRAAHSTGRTRHAGRRTCRFMLARGGWTGGERFPHGIRQGSVAYRARGKRRRSTDRTCCAGGDDSETFTVFATRWGTARREASQGAAGCRCRWPRKRGRRDHSHRRRGSMSWSALGQDGVTGYRALERGAVAIETQGSAA